MGVSTGRLQAGSLTHTRPWVAGPGLDPPSPTVALQIKVQTSFILTTVPNFKVGRAALPCCAHPSAHTVSATSTS